MKKIVVLISGNGSNLERIIEQVEKGYIKAEIALVISDKKDAYGLTRASNHKIDSYILQGDIFEDLKRKLLEISPDLIVLAGFMRILPFYITEAYEKKIINLHPSLLPNYGGAGMYGDKVHEAVIKNREKVSGASVHYVDAGCDTGEIILQEKVNVYNFDDKKSLINRIRAVEHTLLPKVIAELCNEE